MSDKKFENLMDKWASHEIDTAPDLHPTEETYRKIKAEQKKPRFMLFPRLLQWAATGAAAAAVILLTVFYSDLFPPGKSEFAVGLRKEYVTERGGPRRGPVIEPHKGEKRGGKKGPVAFSQLLFQYQKQGVGFREEVDIRSQKDEKVFLAFDDNYRLLFQLFQDRTIHIYQLGSDKKLIRLFPNESYSSVQNPLKGDQLYYLPSTPNWFHLDKNTGEEIIYVVASVQPMSDLDELYDEYARIRNKKKKQEARSRLLDELVSIEKKQLDDIVIQRFSFSNL